MAGAPEFRAKISQGQELAPDQAPVSPAYIGRYRQGVPREDIAFIQAHAGRLMRAFDYQLDDLDYTPAQRLHFNLLTRPKGLLSMWIWLGLEKIQHYFPARLGRTPRSRMLLPRRTGKGQAKRVAGTSTD